MHPPRRWALTLVCAVSAFGVLLGPGVARAQTDCGSLPDPTGYIVDQARVVDDAVERELGERLGAFQASSGGHQVAALVVDSIGERSIEDYANDLFGCWGIGEEGEDTGVLLLVAMEQRRLRIEVGRGLEGDLTDVESAGIIREVITPRFKAGDVSGGIRDGVEAIVTGISGDALAGRRPVAPAPGGGGNAGGAIPFLILLAVFVGISALGGAGRGRGGGGFWPGLILGSMLGGPRGGYGGSSGGGFGGGGGGFGGFGGGGSGGGGASGGW